jgi:hypothetical protein
MGIGIRGQVHGRSVTGIRTVQPRQKAGFHGDHCVALAGCDTLANRQDHGLTVGSRKRRTRGLAERSGALALLRPLPSSWLVLASYP